MAANQSEKASKPPSSFKEQLDKAALGESNDGNREPGTLDTVIDKVTEYVPAAANVLNGLKSQEPKAETEEEAQQNTKDGTAEDETTPQRRLHDVHIEEFVREQHRSNQDVLAKMGK